MAKFIFKKKLTFLFFTACLLTILLIPQIILAGSGVETIKDSLKVTAQKADIEIDRTDLPTMVGSAVNYGFLVLGTIFLGILMFGGFRWMTAGGNEEKVKTGKEFLVNGINGIIVIFLAYALVYVILSALKAAATVE